MFLHTQHLFNIKSSFYTKKSGVYCLDCVLIKLSLAFDLIDRFFDVRRWLIADEAYGSAYGVDILYEWKDGATATQPKYESWVYEERAWDDKCYFFPIKRDELNKNNLLIQNPGY